MTLTEMIDGIRKTLEAIQTLEAERYNIKLPSGYDVVVRPDHPFLAGATVVKEVKEGLFFVSIRGLRGRLHIPMTSNPNTISGVVKVEKDGATGYIEEKDLVPADPEIVKEIAEKTNRMAEIDIEIKSLWDTYASMVAEIENTTIKVKASAGSVNRRLAVFPGAVWTVAGIQARGDRFRFKLSLETHNIRTTEYATGGLERTYKHVSYAWVTEDDIVDI